MKQIRIFTFIGLLLIVMSAPLFAQNFAGGLVVGGNFSQIDGDGIGGFNQIGLKVGGFVLYEFNENFGIQPEINFDQLGSRSNNKNSFGIDYRLNSISVPVLAVFKLRIGERGSLFQSLNFHAGPEFGILISGKDKFLNDEVLGLRTLDYRIVGGFGYRFSNYLEINWRYGLSVNSFWKTPNQVLIIDRNGWFNRYISISLRLYILSPEN